ANSSAVATQQLSSGNSFALIVAKCSTSGIFIASSGKALEHFIPNNTFHYFRPPPAATGQSPAKILAKLQNTPLHSIYSIHYATRHHTPPPPSNSPPPRLSQSHINNTSATSPPIHHPYHLHSHHHLLVPTPQLSPRHHHTSNSRQDHHKGAFGFKPPPRVHSV
nr:hypothetical protein [Tanacetum cinerariifolium]